MDFAFESAYYIDDDDDDEENGQDHQPWVAPVKIDFSSSSKAGGAANYLHSFDVKYGGKSGDKKAVDDVVDPRGGEYSAVGLNSGCGNYSGTHRLRRGTEITVLGVEEGNDQASLHRRLVSATLATAAPSASNNVHTAAVAGTTRLNSASAEPPAAAAAARIIEAALLSKDHEKEGNSTNAVEFAKALKLRLNSDRNLLKIPRQYVSDRQQPLQSSTLSTPRMGGRTHPPTSKLPTTGVFLNDSHRRVDFMLVYESGQPEDLVRQRRYYEKNLRREGLMVEVDPHENDNIGGNGSGGGGSGKLCFLKVHATWETLCRGAEMLQMKMPLRYSGPFFAGGTFVTGFYDRCPSLFTSCFRLNDAERKLTECPRSRITAQFTRARLDQFFIEDKETFFTSTQRIRIVYDIMQQTKCDPRNSKKRGLQWLLKHKVFLAAYPPHDGGTNIRGLDLKEKSIWSQRQVLRYTWANFNRLFKEQPLHLVRSYFGEKIAFYFAWLGFYTKMLVFPSLVGLVSFIYGILSLPNNPVRNDICNNETAPGNFTMCPVCRVPNCDLWILASHCDSAEWNYRFDHESHVFVAIFTLLWATVFVELWKRKEAELACEWNCYDSEQDDCGLRPEFECRTQLLRVSPITNEEEPYISKLKRTVWFVQSLAGMLFLILLVILALIGLIAARITFYGFLKDFGGIWFKMQFELASLAIHLLTFLVVWTLGYIYEKVAHRLTELECPRTQSDYLTSYIWKVFIFELLNNFAPIFYAAMIRGRNLSGPSQQSYVQEMCDPGGCLNEVVQAVSILLLARLLISNAAELGVPFLKSVWKDMRLGGGSLVRPDGDLDGLNLPRWHKDFTLNEPKLDGVYAEYLEMMVQFGYVTLFVAAFPLAPLICLVNNLVEIRLDATNFVITFRRPLPVRVPGIRIWRRCLNIIIKLAVLCNGGFLAFTSELIPQIIYRYYYSGDHSLKGYVEFTLSKFDTSDWPDFKRYHPAYTHCYFRDFRDKSNPNSYSIVWWQIMVARLAFFIIFVIFFYFFQWLCEFLVSDVPEAVKLRIERENFLARLALYGNEIRNDVTSATPTRRSSRVATTATAANAAVTSGLIENDFQNYNGINLNASHQNTNASSAAALLCNTTTNSFNSPIVTNHLAETTYL